MGKNQIQDKKETVDVMEYIIWFLTGVALVYLILFYIDQEVKNFISADLNYVGMTYVVFWAALAYSYDPNDTQESIDHNYFP